MYLYRMSGLDDLPYREHTFQPVKVTGTLLVEPVLHTIELVSENGTSYKLAKKKDASLGGIRYYRQREDVTRFTPLIGKKVTVEGVLDTFQDYGSGSTTIRVIRGPKVTVSHGPTIEASKQLG